MHPLARACVDDPYKQFIGKKAITFLVNRAIPIIADQRVGPAYGTGVIKVTPAHDFADFDIGMDHKLEEIQVIGKDGLMTDAAGATFAGMKTSLLSSGL
ncbi:MAG: class I tRNA ligase family protein [Bdellovibrionota bacterium]|nr:MAG: class I tRNA ligase family protein [Bdellovibrionota bacterium]